MFGQTFYFSTLRKYVIYVGTLFDDIRVLRTNANGDVIENVKVPITYAPKEKMLARVFQDANLDRPSATMPLPMISFEMGKITYDGSRKLPTVGKVVKKAQTPNEPDKFRYQYNPVPYNVDFKVHIYAKHVEDGTKVLEQILPYFTPDWTSSLRLIPEMDITMDIPVVLNDVSYSDTYEGELDKSRQIIWTLDLTVKGYFYGPIKKTAIIKFVNVNFMIPSVPDGHLADAVGSTPISYKITVQPGLAANGAPINWHGAPNNATGTIPYTEIEANNDYGYITQIYDTEDIT